MPLTIGTTTIQAIAEENGLRLKTEFENVLLAGLTEEEAKSIILENFELVRALFQNHNHSLTVHEINELSLKLVLRYLCLYSQWKAFYPHERNRDLKFIAKDLEHPMTFDAVVEYMKLRHPKKYREFSAGVLGVDMNQFSDYEKARKEFMERR